MSVTAETVRPDAQTQHPEKGKYQHIEHLRSGSVALLHLPGAVIQLAELFPGP